jgi:hypothetical protein
MVTIIPGSLGGIIVSLQKLQLPIRIVTASTTVLDTDFTIEADASLGNIIITLPTAASQFDGATHSGTIYNVKKIDSTGNSVTVQPQGIDKIDELGNVVITAQDVSIMIQSDGTKWVRL